MTSPKFMSSEECGGVVLGYKSSLSHLKLAHLPVLRLLTVVVPRPSLSPRWRPQKNHREARIYEWGLGIKHFIVKNIMKQSI
ncbi:hypothetical protein SESBI_28466 [Sesbania bispinosa]|nr:hypothetical protein SESBI_28466 [Sesbania bispinosa]